VVKNLDRLSDMLCGVIDLAELVRNAHPDRLWAEAANHAYETLCEFMNVLNTHTGLYEVSLLLVHVSGLIDMPNSLRFFGRFSPTKL
jgi:mitochondrial intermediate peptidase